MELFGSGVDWLEKTGMLWLRFEKTGMLWLMFWLQIQVSSSGMVVAVMEHCSDGSAVRCLFSSSC